MKALIIQHVDYEKPGVIEEWLRIRGVEYRILRLYEGESLPGNADFDYLFVMGGPMGVYDEDEYPWLVKEKRFIRNAIMDGKRILGICLGAQLIADVLGAEVRRGVCGEYGWKPVHLTPSAVNMEIFHDFPDEFIAFHWHSDAFEIPDGAENLIRTDDCESQAFRFSGALALQFHLEMTPDLVKTMMEREGMGDDSWLSPHLFRESRRLMFKILDRL